MGPRAAVLKRRRPGLDANDVRERVDARTVARALGVVPVRETRSGWTIRCVDPAHEDRNPSAWVGARGWGCRACDAGGDVFDLVATVRGLDRRRDFREILRAVAELGGVVADSGRPIPGQAPPPAPRNQAPRIKHDSEARASLVAQVWQAVSHLGPTDAARAWCNRRGFDVRTAWRANLRDPAPARAALDDLWTFAFDTVRAAGLEDWRPWWRWSGGWGGLVVPCCDPDTQAPSLRWRFTDPPGDLKAMGLPDSGGATVLGLETVTRARTVFVTEGEPDWIATLDALAQLGAHDAGAVGLCSVSKGWRATWGHWIASADRVVVMVHRGRGEHCTADRIAGQVADSLAELRDTTPRALHDAGAVVRVPVPDDNDLADHHKRGELARSIVGHL